MKKINALSILSGFSVTELFAKKNIRLNRYIGDLLIYSTLIMSI